MANPPLSSRRIGLTVAAPLLELDAGEAAPAIAVYAFSAGGRLLAQSPLDERGQAQLELGVGNDPTGIRVLAGPASDDKEPALDELLRRGAQEQHLRLDADAERLQVELSLPADVWRNWLLNRCLVKGTLQKRVLRDGVTIDLPVCRATVEIYEVDPIWILVPKIPKDLLDRLREVIVKPIPLPDPAPDRLPHLPGVGPLRRSAIARALPAAFESHRVDAEAIAAMQQVAGAGELRYAAISGSDLAFRQALIDNARLVRPILCWLNPLFVTMRRIGTAFTDDCGHFRTTVFKSIFNPDQPDLYFEATQRLFGFFDVTIYAPTPIACHTWWNYVCGSEVSLFTHHPLAITCSPCPPVIAGDNWVLFMAIGNHPLSRIHGTSQALGASTAFNVGLTDGDAPWGGTLRPRLEFDNALRENLGVMYYRLSWKKSGEASFTNQLNSVINRHYSHMVNGHLVLDAYLLGPKTKGAESNLFEIPPAVPPLGQWSIPDAVEDTASGRFFTTTAEADGSPLLDGLIDLRVELFDAAGAPVDIAAKGIRYFVPTSTDLSSTIYTADAASLGLVVGNTMIVTLHINNEPCTAAIAPPVVNGAAADDCCGVLHYADGNSCTMGWAASHPHGFATYSFGVVRGVSGVFGQSGAVAGGAFSASRTVAQLLSDNPPPNCGDTQCTVAGFSENLYVATSAFDGWSRLSGYDASDVRAFVLAPESGVV